MKLNNDCQCGVNLFTVYCAGLNNDYDSVRIRTYARAYSWNLEERLFLNFLKAFLSFNRMTYLLFRINGCLCLNISFILFLFHKRTARSVLVGWKTKKMYPSLPPTAFFFVLICSKCSVGNARNGISETFDLKTLWETCAQTPYFGVRSAL